LITRDGDSPSFLGATDLLFRQLGEKASYLARIHTDGTGLARVTEQPIVGKGEASPDGEWAIASGLSDPSKLVGGTYAISLKDGSRRPLCIVGCFVKWSLDGKFLFLSSAFGNGRNTSGNAGRTLVVPVPRGLEEAAIPAVGFDPAADQEFAGVREIRQQQVAPGFDANTYAYTTAEFQGNLFRIPLH